MGDLRCKKILKILLVISVILISGLIIYKVHYSYTGFIQNPHTKPSYIAIKNFNYPFPIHADEWTHLSQIIYILDSKTLGFRNPYSPDLIFHKDFELGFHLFLAALFKFTSFDPVLWYQFLPAIFFIVNASLLFLFMKKLTNNYYIALFSILFFLAIPSNTNFLGNWFAVPLTFSIFSIYLFFICLDEFIKTNKNKYIIFTIIAYMLSLCYPFATILITLITFLYLVFEIKIYRQFKKYKTLIISGSITILLILILFRDYLFSLTFHREWTFFQYDYSLIFFYGLLPTTLGSLWCLFCSK